MKTTLFLPLAQKTLCALALFGAAASAAPVSIQLRNAAGQPLADAVVAVQLRGQASRAAPGSQAQMEQRNRQFKPDLLVVQTGTAVLFPNFDTVRHHVYSFSATKKFDLKLYSGTPAEPVLFDKAGVAALGCNIHDGMSAHILVVDTPIFGKTDAKGYLTLDLPAGEHLLRYWHASANQPLLRSQTINVGAEPRAVELQTPADF